MDDTTWNAIRNALYVEFHDVDDLAEAAVLLVRMVIAIVLAGVIGLEREHRDAPAGLRTHMLVGLGSALFVLVPLQAGVSPADLTRVVQGVVSGIGFLGAGAILKESRGNQVRGLTTAASVFATAAIGVTAGMGKAMTAIMATGLVLFILALLHRWEKRLGLRTEDRQTQGSAEGGATDAIDDMDAGSGTGNRGV